MLHRLRSARRSSTSVIGPAPVGGLDDLAYTVGSARAESQSPSRLAGKIRNAGHGAPGATLAAISVAEPERIGHDQCGCVGRPGVVATPLPFRGVVRGDSAVFEGDESFPRKPRESSEDERS